MTELYYYEGRGSIARAMMVSVLYPFVSFLVRFSDDAMSDYDIEERWGGLDEAMPLPEHGLGVDTLSDLVLYLKEADWKIYFHPDQSYMAEVLTGHLKVSGKEETDYKE